MKWERLAAGKAGECGDVVNDAVGEIGRRADKENGVAVDEAGNGGDMNTV